MVDLEPGWSFGVKSFMCKYGLVILYYRLLNYSILTKQSQFWLHVSAFFRSCGPHRVILIGRWSLFSCYRDWCELVPWCDFIRFYPCWPCNTFMPIFKPTWRKYLVDLDLGLFFLLLFFFQIKWLMCSLKLEIIALSLYPKMLDVHARQAAWRHKEA